MLVLTRRGGEAICVGDGITITVLGTQAGKARIGISAPAHVRVDRREVRERIGASTYSVLAAGLLPGDQR
jgi:carbon storage regulator